MHHSSCTYARTPLSPTHAHSTRAHTHTRREQSAAAAAQSCACISRPQLRKSALISLGFTTNWARLELSFSSILDCQITFSWTQQFRMKVAPGSRVAFFEYFLSPFFYLVYVLLAFAAAKRLTWPGQRSHAKWPEPKAKDWRRRRRFFFGGCCLCPASWNVVTSSARTKALHNDVSGCAWWALTPTHTHTHTRLCVCFCVLTLLTNSIFSRSHRWGIFVFSSTLYQNFVSCYTARNKSAANEYIKYIIIYNYI